MKRCFENLHVPQARWYEGPLGERNVSVIKSHFGITKTEEYQLVGKAICGFQGKGMVLINNDTELADFCRHHTSENFYLELYMNLSREYRLHATQDEVFMSWRKLRKSDANERWFFNSHNCNWVGENHELFNKPSNWDYLCETACNAIRSVGLDIGCVDLRISSKDPSQFIILETNSGPSLGEQGVEIYRIKIKEILEKKFKNN